MAPIVPNLPPLTEEQARFLAKHERLHLAYGAPHMSPEAHHRASLEIAAFERHYGIQAPSDEELLAGGPRPSDPSGLPPVPDMPDLALNAAIDRGVEAKLEAAGLVPRRGAKR